MSRFPLRVVIVGAGLAGSCLAQSLLRSGVDVSLHERDDAVDARGQGYRIHVAAEGAAALRACLSPELYELAVATAGRWTRDGAVTVLDDGLGEVNRVPFPAPTVDDGSAGLTVDRLILRQVLLAGLGERLHFGAPFSRFETTDAGRVRVHFAGGECVEADVLVGAEGAGSPVRNQLLPQARVLDTGVLEIYGKTPLDEEVRALTPPASLQGFSTVTGSNGRFLPLAAMEFRTDPRAAAAHVPGLELPHTPDYLMWVMCGPASSLGVSREDLGGLDSRELIEVAARAVTDWHPNLREIIRRGDPATVMTTEMRTAEPLEHWPTGPVTLVGDAIHCMVPAGIGAAVGLRDAALLGQRLGEVARGERALLEAVAAYETEMLQYGFEAVAASQQVARGNVPV